METTVKKATLDTNINVQNIYDETGNTIGKVVETDERRFAKTFDKVF